MLASRVTTLGAVLVMILGMAVPAAAAQTQNAGSHDVPVSIPADCSRDVTKPLLDWIEQVPDGSTLRFAADGCYRIDGSLRIEDRWGLTFDGRGATFRAMTDGDRDRRHFWFFGGGDLTIQNLTVLGANPVAGTSEPAYRPDRAFQHAFALQGVHGARLQRVEAYDVYGDFVYLGPDGAGHRTAVHGWSQDIEVVDSTFARNGRQGIATVAAQDVLIARNDIRDVRRAIFNIEPTGSTWGAERVTIEQNVTGRSRLLWLTSGGRGSNVRDVIVRDNQMEIRSGVPVIHMVAPEGHRWGPITIVDNDFIVGGSPAPALRLYRLRDVTVTGNRLAMEPIRRMTAVRLYDVHGAIIARNTFAGALVDLEAIESTGVVRSERTRFSDVGPSSVHARAIKRLSEEGFVFGCAPQRFCPQTPITRAEVSAFIASALGLSMDRSTPPPFPDVAVAAPHAASIEAVHRAGLLSGYVDGTFGPNHELTRAQVASILVEAFELQPTGTGLTFSDVKPGGVHSRAITTLAQHGLSRGCEPDRYCGQQSVTRAQMAALLDRGIRRPVVSDDM